MTNVVECLPSKHKAQVQTQYHLKYVSGQFEISSKTLSHKQIKTYNFDSTHSTRYHRTFTLTLVLTYLERKKTESWEQNKVESTTLEKVQCKHLPTSRPTSEENLGTSSPSHTVSEAFNPKKYIYK